MDRLEDKIKLSRSAVDQLIGGSKQLERNTDVKDDVNIVRSYSKNLTIKKEDVSKKKSSSLLVLVDRTKDDGCTFSQQPSGLSSNVKVSNKSDCFFKLS